MGEAPQSLHRAMEFERVRRQIQDASPEEARAIARVLLDSVATYERTTMGAAWKLGALEREVGDLRRKLVELQAG